MIAAAPQLGLRRQVFFVGLRLLRHPRHSRTAANPTCWANSPRPSPISTPPCPTSAAPTSAPAVTTFTASDFGRTFTTNGDGTDHAWGSHHFVMGGAVKGGDIYGQYPTIGVDQGAFANPDMVGSILIPTTSVDQYGATLGAWFGASPRRPRHRLPEPRQVQLPKPRLRVTRGALRD